MKRQCRYVSVQQQTTRFMPREKICESQGKRELSAWNHRPGKLDGNENVPIVVKLQLWSCHLSAARPGHSLVEFFRLFLNEIRF